MRRKYAQFLILVRREIDDEEMPAAAQHPCRLRDHAVGLVREVQRLMDDDAVDARIVHRQRQKIALHQVDRDRLIGQFGARETQHFRAAVERGDAPRGRRENLCHPASARSDVEQMTEPAPRHHRQHRGFHLALCDVAGADRVPFGGMFGEIARGGGRAVVADGG